MFRQVQTTNNWMVDEYFIMVGQKKEILSPHAYVSAHGTKRCIKSAWVEWPDGSREHARILYRQESRSCMDMGHEYTTTSPVLEVKVSCRGIPLVVNLAKLKIDPQTIKWSMLKN